MSAFGTAAWCTSTAAARGPWTLPPERPIKAIEQRGDWDTTVVAAELTSTADQFRLRESIEALEGGKTIFERSWDNTIARDCM